MAIVRFLRKVADALETWLQAHCRHGSYRSIADAWDYEYICTRCEKRWFNERPADAK